MTIQARPALFSPIQVGKITLQHRIVLAPLTRIRARADHVPGPQQASYYAQRGSTPGSLLITEATFISHDAGGYKHVPGVYTDAQIKGWKQVTDAVHAKGSYIFLQLWALGRAAFADVLAKQDPPSPYIAASPVPLRDHSETPRALTEDEIQATQRRTGAGFDGVEIHGANGYLIDQFLQTVSNTRTDGWGGNEEGRTRFARCVVDAVVDAVGPERVGLRISPWSTYQDMKMSDPLPTFEYLIAAVRDKHPTLAYLHVIEPRIVGDSDGHKGEDESNDSLRTIWHGGQGGERRVFISAGGYTRETALHSAEEKGGLVAFGRLYISNPDLPFRLLEDLALTKPDRSKYYLEGNPTPLGYNDWTFADGSVRDMDVATPNL